MHTFGVVVTRFMGCSYYAQMVVDDVPQRPIVGVELFRTPPVSAEQLTRETRATLKELVRAMARKSHTRPGEIIWAA